MLLYDNFGDKIGEIGKCRQQFNVDARTITQFEEASDFKTLPDDRSLKCFMLCSFQAYGFIVPNNTRLQFGKLFDTIAQLEYEQRSIFLKMASGCTKLRSKDLCEAAYEINLCMKRNYNEYYYLPVDTEFWLRFENDSHSVAPVTTET